MSADLQRVIRIVFEGDNQTQKAFSEISKGLDTFENAVRGVTGPLSDAADKVLKLQAAMMTLATGGIALSVKEAGNFNDSFNEISTLIDATEPELQKFKEEFKDYARVTKFSLEDMSAAVYEAISRYTDYTESLSFVSTAEKLAIAGKSDLTSATVLLASTLAAYGEEVDQAGRYSDVFFTIVKEGGTTLPQIADSLAKLTAIAGPSGISIEELGAGLATLTAQGMPTTEAMTALRGIIQAVISPTSQAAEAASQLGIDFSLAGVQAKGLDGFLLDIYERTGGNVEEMAKLFTNVRGLTGVLAAFGQDGGDLFLEKLLAMQNAAGSTETAYAKMAENFALINQQLVNNIQMTLVEIGEPLLAGYGELAESIMGIFQNLSIGINEGAFDPLFDLLNGVMKDLTAYLEKVGEVLPEALSNIDWSKFIKGFEELNEALGGVFDAFFQNLDPTDAEDLEKIIQNIFDSIGTLSTIAAGIVKQWEPVIETIGKLIEVFGKMDDKTAESVGEMLGWSQKMETLWDKFGFIGGTLVALAIELDISADTMRKAFEIMVAAAKMFFDYYSLAINLIMGTGQVAFGTLYTAILSVADIFAQAALAVAHFANAITLGKFDTFDDMIVSLTEMRERLDASNASALNMANDGLVRLRDQFITLGETEVDVPITAQADADSFNFVEHMLETFGEEQNPVVDPDVEPLKVKADEVDERMKFEAELDKTQAQTEMERIKADAAIIQTQMEWQAKVDIAEIEAKSAIIQSKIEWDAKLDIAEVEANAAIMVALADSVAAAWEATGTSLASAYQAYADADHQYKSTISAWINEELRMRRELLELQQEMFLVQKNYMEAKTDALKRGDGMIQIDGAGLQPHLEAFMWEVLSAIQVRVNEEGMDMLLGTEDLM